MAAVGNKPTRRETFQVFKGLDPVTKEHGLVFNSHYLFEMEKLAIRRQSSLRLLSRSPAAAAYSSSPPPTHPPTTYRFSASSILRALVVQQNNSQKKKKKKQEKRMSGRKSLPFTI